MDKGKDSVDSENMFEREAIGFANRLNVGCAKKTLIVGQDSKR